MSRVTTVKTRGGNTYTIKEYTAGDDCDIYDYASGVDRETGAPVILVGKQQIARILYGVVTPKLTVEQVRAMSTLEKNELLIAIAEWNTPVPLATLPPQSPSTGVNETSGDAT